MRPGTNVSIQSQAPPVSAPNNTGTWFVAGITTQGPTTPQPASSFAGWQEIYGARGSNPILSDAVETYFAQGGSQVWTARVVGPNAVNASVSLKDASAAATLTIAAQGPGAYANGYQIVVAVVNTTHFTITVEDASGNTLETSGTLTDVADAVAYGATSEYITVTAVGTTNPAAGTFALAGGNDDLTDIQTAQYQTAHEQFTTDHGPGMRSCPGVSTTAVMTMLAQMCENTIWVAIGDLPDTSTLATLLSSASPLTALGAPARAIGLFTPWLDISPAVGTTGNRAVPPSAFYAGRAAASDGATGNPNLPIAGLNGIVSAVDVHNVFSDADRQTLNTAGINVIRQMANDIRIYGNVTAVNRLTDPLYFMLSNVRLDAAILNDAEAIQEDFMFSQIDGSGIDAANFGAQLVSMLTEWQSAPKNAIYGPFTVDISSDVNTPTTIAEGELLGTIAYSRSPGAEQVNLNIVRLSAAA